MSTRLSPLAGLALGLVTLAGLDAWAGDPSAPAAAPNAATTPSAATAPGAAPAAALTPYQAECQRFLDLYNSLYLSINTASNEAAWAASTNVGPLNEGRRTGAGEVYAAVVGDPQLIRTVKGYLANQGQLQPIQVRQLKMMLLEASANPGTIPEVVSARVAAESRAASVQDGFAYCFTPRAADGSCPAPKTANDVDEVLRGSKDLRERATVWSASKEIGRPLKPELVELRKLRNQLAREMGYTSYFDLQVAAYDMSTPEMMAMLDGFVADMAPLYKELSTWATWQLADRYGASPPKGGVPAHWYPNRWAQEWTGLVNDFQLDPYFVKDTPENIVRRAERFYQSMGFAPVPESFWAKSDMFPAPPGRQKNSHASAWHMDLRGDIRSLMSVESNAEWFFTANHELGHVHYYIEYSRPEVPPLLRTGANRGFHEAVGELISMAAGQLPYLRQAGILPPEVQVSTTNALLVDALERTVAFVPWSAGVMTHFEYELYEKDLPPDQWQRRWWEMVKQYQGVVPPDELRLTDPNACDACTKTHIIDDPAGYYDYAVATVVKFQLHRKICRDVIHQDVHSCNYADHPEVGAFLSSILRKGATEDWRVVLREATGEELSSEAMVEYFAPLQTWLAAENKKAARRGGVKK